MEVQIVKMGLENYKCFQNKEIEFGKRTTISGKNRSGKTTMMDAYFDAFTGKLADGTSPDKVRPHDADGVEVPKVDISRELTLLIDGQEHVIRKITSQKWRKPRGQAEEVLDGNETTYEVDGFQMKSKEFTEFMNKIAPNDTLVMCSNATPFITLLRKSTTDARKMLERLSGFDLEAFIKTNPQYLAISDITKGHSIEDTMKKLRKQQTEQKKKQDAKNTEIKYEQGINPVKIEVSDLELEKGIYRDKIAELEKSEEELENSKAEFEELARKKVQLHSRMQEIKNAAGYEARQKKDILESECAQLKKKYREYGDSINYYTDLAEKTKREYDAAKTAITENEIKLRKEEQTVFDEKHKYCSTCGQQLPEDKLEEVLSSFEKNHKMLITRWANQLNEAKSYASNAKSKLANYTEKISELMNERDAVKDEYLKKSSKLNAYTGNVDLSENEEYVTLAAEYTKISEAMEKTDDYFEKRRQLHKERGVYQNKISDIEAKVRNANAEQERHEHRLDTLKTDLLSISQILADIERQIDIVQEFSIKKNEALADMINAHFRHFKFKFLEYTLEGNPVETCRMMVDGTDYNNGLNGGDRRLTEIDLCRGLQELNGLRLPIWCDEAGTVDSWRIPSDMEQQLVLIEYRNSDFEVNTI